MVKAAICDDEPAMVDIMKNVVQDVFEREQFPCELSCFTNGADLLKAYADSPYDILFLDIHMPEQSGFEIAQNIRNQSDKTVILFVTSQDELVYDSFNYRPFYFLRKGDASVFSDSFSPIVRRVTTFIKRNQLITLNMGVGEEKIVPVQDILYLEGSRHHVIYYLFDDEVCRIRQLLSDAETQFAAYGFVRIYKRFIVNIQKVQRINMSRYPSVTLYSGKELPLGRAYKNSFYEQYREQMRNRL